MGHRGNRTLAGGGIGWTGKETAMKIGILLVLLGGVALSQVAGVGLFIMIVSRLLGPRQLSMH